MNSFNGIIGLLALCLVLVFQKGGNPLELLQWQSGLLVVLGTLLVTGASYSWREVRAALKAVSSTRQKNVLGSAVQEQELVQLLIDAAKLARKEGLASLETVRHRVADELLKRLLKNIIEGMEAPQVSELLRVEIQGNTQRYFQQAAIFESAGSYAPALGTIGAILGLLPVLSRMDSAPASALGSGLSGAFVAMLYGLILSQGLLLPWAERMRREAATLVRRAEAVRVALQSIQEGDNPKFLEEKLRAMQLQGGVAP